jgi:hypothetical protein
VGLFSGSYPEVGEMEKIVIRTVVLMDVVATV